MDELVVRLLEVVGLILPASAIYLQILHSRHVRRFEHAPPQQTAHEYLEYQLTKGAVFFLTISGLLAIMYLLGSEFPCVLETEWCMIIRSITSYSQQISIGVALFLLAGSVHYSEQLEEDDRSIWSAIRVYLRKLLTF